MTSYGLDSTPLFGSQTSHEEIELTTVYGAQLQHLGVRPKRKGNWIFSSKAVLPRLYLKYYLALSLLFLVCLVQCYFSYAECVANDEGYCGTYASGLALFPVLMLVVAYFAGQIILALDNNEVVFSDFDQVVMVSCKKAFLGSLRNRRKFDVPYSDVATAEAVSTKLSVLNIPCSSVVLRFESVAAPVSIMITTKAHAPQLAHDLISFIHARKQPDSWSS